MDEGRHDRKIGSLSQLTSQIEQLLTAALNVLVATKAESIVQTGERGDNLQLKYKDYLP